MPLRAGAHEITVARVGHPPRLALTRVFPDVSEEAEQRRVVVAEQAGASASPRVEGPASVHVPLEQRQQSALYFQLPNSLQQELVGTGATPGTSRREAQRREERGVSATLQVSHVGDGEAESVE